MDVPTGSRFPRWEGRAARSLCLESLIGQPPVLKYLARYTYRVAISNRRLLSLEDGIVRFRYRDYAHGRRMRTLSLHVLEFTRRFLMHVLPKGFVRIRRYGLLAPSEPCHVVRRMS